MIESIGKNIRKYRNEKNMRQEDLAEKTGLSTNYIGMIERGEKLPSLDTFIEIANALDVSSDMLLCEVINRSAGLSGLPFAEKIEAMSKEDRKIVYNVLKTLLESL